MYVQSIKFKRTEYSEWEKGYYVGETDNSEKSVILDANYRPVEVVNGCSVWDYLSDTDNWIQFRCNG